MAVSTIKTTQMTWGFLNSRLNREPIDAASLNNSYTDLLWELNQTSSTYELGKSNTGGSSNFYVGLITSVPYVNKGHGQNEDGSLKGPWYVTYCGSDPNEGTGKYAFTGHIDDPINAANTYYADRIVLKRELDYALDKNTVSPLLLGTYYTGVGHWYDSYTKSKEYRDENKELPDGIYFPTTSYAEIFNDYTNNVATGEFSHAEGRYTTASGNYGSHAEGYYTKASGRASHAEGGSAIAYGSYSHAEGYYSYAEGTYSHTEGSYTYAIGENSHAEGSYTYSIGDSSHVEGINSYSYGLCSHAEGGSAIAYGSYTHAEGYYSYAEGTYSHAEGSNTYAIGENSHAEGSYTYSIGDSSHVEGINSYSYGLCSHAEGGSVIAYGAYSHAEGYYSYAEGTYSHAEGRYTYATGQFSHAEGNRNKASGEVSHAEGNRTTASGEVSHAEGDLTTASGDYGSHAEGYYTKASGRASHAEGNYTRASGNRSHAEGWSTSAYGNDGSHAEGDSTAANGDSSHAEGDHTTASGNSSHAEGYSTGAIGNNSHTEGSDTIARGKSSHAEGSGTRTAGYACHAEGSGTTASEYASHAEGYDTTARGESSHAEGQHTIATNLVEHAQGKYNISDIYNSGTLFTIGNGTADDKRHNVVGIYHNGDINIEGQNTTNHSIGYFKSAIDGDYTQTIGTVGKNNTCNVIINGTSDTRISGATYEGYDSTFISTTKDAKSTYSYSTTYIYSEGDVTDTTAGTRTVVTDGDVSITNKANIYIATNGTHTENIDTTRSTIVGDHDSLVVNSNGRTEKITGEKITQVISGNINAYTDSTHDTRLNTRSAYLETAHAYIGDKVNTVIDGNYSIGLGQGIKVSSDTNVTVGKYNKDEASYFAVGIGTDDTNRKNAFWISQSNDAGYNGICYFSDNTYVYGNTYDPGQYPDNKEDKSWSPVVTYNMYRNSYECLYNIIIDKLDIVDQYNSIMNRLKKLEEEVIWRSRIGVNGTNVLNKATYLWTGTLNEFNSLESKPADTTFIISN